MAKAGLPVVVFVHDKFERAARAQAKSMGYSDLRFYVFPQDAAGADSTAIEEKKAEQAAAALESLLLRN